MVTVAQVIQILLRFLIGLENRTCSLLEFSISHSFCYIAIKVLVKSNWKCYLKGHKKVLVLKYMVLVQYEDIVCLSAKCYHWFFMA